MSTPPQHHSQWGMASRQRAANAHIFNPIPPVGLVYLVASQRFCFLPCRVLPAGQAWPLFVTRISHHLANALPWHEMGWGE